MQDGGPPCRVDVITSIDGVAFEEAWPNRFIVDLDGLTAPMIGRAELLRHKRAAGRPKDVADVSRLESQQRSE